MTLHAPKHPNPGTETPESRKASTTKRPPRKTTGFTLGSLLGEAVRADQAVKARRAELDDMGFRALGEA